MKMVEKGHKGSKIGFENSDDVIIKNKKAKPKRGSNPHSQRQTEA